MLKYFSSMACLGILVVSCASKNGMDQGDSAGGGGYIVGSGGSGAENSSLNGGKTIATADILAQIEMSACAGTSSELEVSPALLEFIVDVSGSMNDVPKGASQTKWQITQAALSDAILSKLPDATSVGILFFPNMDTAPNHNDISDIRLPVANCVNTAALVAPAPLDGAGSEQRVAIEQALANAHVGGGTPTDDAYEYAYNRGLLPAIQTYGFFTPFMVLITDGQPTILLNCEGTGQTAYPVDWHPIVNDIASVYNATPIVKTFIIGSPGSEAQSTTGADGRPWLSLAAQTGGTPITPNCSNTGPHFCHFDMTQSTDFAGDLSTALNDIITAAIPCAVKIPPPTNGGVPDSTKINVVYQENVVNAQPAQEWLIGQTSDTSCMNGTADGWYIDPADPSGEAMVLCPTTCQTVQMDKNAVLNVHQGCKSITPPPT